MFATKKIFIIPIITISMFLVAYCFITSINSSKKNNESPLDLGIIYQGIPIQDIILIKNKIYYGGYPSQGVFSFDIKNGENTKIANLEGNVYSLLYYNNNLYVGSYGGGGLYKISLENNEIEDLHFPGDSNYLGDLIESNGLIYGINSRGKFFIYNTNKKIFDKIINLSEGFARLTILSNGIIIGGTISGATLFSYDPKRDKIERLYQFEDDTAIAKLVTDSNDIIWGSTSPGNKIFRFSIKDKKIQIFTHLLLQNNYFYDLALSSDGKIFFSTSPEGLLGYFDPLGKTLSPSIIKNSDYQPSFLSISEDILVGGGYCNNPFVYDIKKEKLKQISFDLPNDNGFPIVSLYADPKNHLLWGGTALNRSLFNFNIKNGSIKKFGNILGIGNIDSLAEIKDELYLGLYSGADLALYDLDKPFMPPKNPKIILEIKPETSRISALIEGNNEEIIGGTTCDRPFCQDASWFIYKNEKILKNVPISGEKIVTSLAKRDNYVLGGTYPNGKIFKINLNNFTLEKIEKIESNNKYLIVGRDIFKSYKDIFASLDNKLIKINSNNFKEYSILAESKSDIITSILVIKNTIYFSTKGGELLKYDLNTNSL